MVGGQGHALDMALDKVAITIGQRRAGAACVEVIAQRGNDERLEVGGGNAADRSGRPRFLLQHGLGDVIAVARAALICMSKMRPVRSAGEPRSRQRRATAWAASLPCTA